MATMCQIFRRILEKSILAIIRLYFTFSTIFLVNNGHRAIKVHVNKVQYCRAGNTGIGLILKLVNNHIVSMYHRIMISNSND